MLTTLFLSPPQRDFRAGLYQLQASQIFWGTLNTYVDCPEFYNVYFWVIPGDVFLWRLA